MLLTPESCIGSPLKNSMILGFSFLFLYTGYNGSVNLMSTINIEDGLGMTAQATFYFVAILGSATVPPLCMRMFGIKKTIVLSIVLFSPYIASNFVPHWYTFLPAAALMGLARGPLWSTSMSYLSSMADRHTSSKKQANTEASVFFFLGLLGSFLGLTNVFGNVISYLVLGSEETHLSMNKTQEILELCGVNFCDRNAIRSGFILQPSYEKVWLLTGIYVGFVFLSFLLNLLFLDKMELSEVGIATKDSVSIMQLIAVPFRRLKVAQHWYLLPLTVFSGVQESFLVGDFTKAYVACSGGIHNIGLYMITYGALISTCSFIGWVARFVDRAFIFTTGSLVQTAAIVLLWFWTPDTPNYVLSIIPAIWGLGTVVWQSQLQGMYGVLFADAKGASFSVQTGLQGMGYMIGFALSSRVCTAPKLYILSSLLVLGMTGYVAAELSYRRSKRKAPPSTRELGEFQNPGSLSQSNV